MALETKGRLTDREQICVRGTVSRVAIHAIFRYRRMLVGKRPPILGMTAEAELIHVGGPQVVARRPSVRIVAIHATHLSFAKRVMVRHAELRSLRLVALEAGLIGC